MSRACRVSAAGAVAIAMVSTPAFSKNSESEGKAGWLVGSELDNVQNWVLSEGCSAPVVKR